MVEGIVIMTTMLVFLGMNIFAYRAYGGKMDQANSTRRDALFYASHSCGPCNDLDPDSYTDAALKGTRCGGGGSSLSFQGIIDAVRGGADANFDIMATARSHKEKTQVSGTAVVNATPQRGINMTRAVLQANIETKSAVGCNEKPYYNKWAALFQMGFDFLKGMVTG